MIALASWLELLRQSVVNFREHSSMLSHDNIVLLASHVQYLTFECEYLWQCEVQAMKGVV